MTNIILASSSPRRKKILEEMEIKFKIVSSEYEEILDNTDFTYEKIETLAFNKGKAVAEKITPPSIILSADTVVVLKGQILGKPEGKSDAIKMLKALRGEKHSVVTSICAINTGTAEEKILSATSYVEFENISDNSIINYIELYKPYDKAGSYGIQELPNSFIRKIEGSLENIIGLCPNTTKKILCLVNGNNKKVY